jgi:hypothetical protein
LGALFELDQHLVWFYRSVFHLLIVTNSWQPRLPTSGGTAPQGHEVVIEGPVERLVWPNIAEDKHGSAKYV